MESGETPDRLCRICTHPVADCLCPDVLCLWCLDSTDSPDCDHCNGAGVSSPERVSVIPDKDAYAIREYLRSNPGLQKEAYTDPDTDPLQGLCYPAAEAYYHVTGKQLDVYCLSWEDVEDETDGTHWYLRDPETTEFIDISLPFQSGVELPPFEAGRRRGFMTGDTPSKRTKQVLDHLGYDW